MANQRLRAPDPRNPYSYLGGQPNAGNFTRRPLPTDVAGYELGYLWFIPKIDSFPIPEIWWLSSISDGFANWTKISSGATSIKKIYLTDPQSGTYVPSLGMIQCYVECIGGGGSGSTQVTYFASEDGPLYWYFNIPGGAGGYSAKLYSASDIGGSQPYVVGSGGIAPTADADLAGNPGQDTTFGSGSLLITGGMGLGGGERSIIPADRSNAGGLGGTASGGDININGQNGWAFLNEWATGTLYRIAADGNSGQSFYGQSKYCIKSTNLSPVPTGLNGENGSGGGSVVLINSSTSGKVIGGNGGNGCIVITEIISDNVINPVPTPPVNQGDLIHLQTVFTNNSPVPFLALSGDYFAQYNSFLINLDNIAPDTGGSMQLNMYMSIDNGSTFISLTGGGLTLFKSDGTFTYLSNSGTGGQPVIGNLNSTLSGGGNGQIYLSFGDNLPPQDRLPKFSGTSMGSVSAETSFGSFGGLYLNNTNQVNYIKFVWENDSRNILDGSISIYAYKNS